MNPDDKHNLNRFIESQDSVYQQVRSELINGKKRSHWMWFIFPQIDGLGSSSTAQHYAIKSKDEAIAYLTHPVLGKRLIECAEIVLAVNGHSASEIFGFPDYLKFRSSITLFATVSESGSIFEKNIDKYFSGEADSKTIEILYQTIS